MKEKMLGSIWFWWVVTTIFYVVMLPVSYKIDGLIGGILSIIARIVGLFVPFGLLSSIMYLAAPAILIPIGLFVFIYSMNFANKKIKSKNVSLAKQIGLIFLALFIITFLIDIVRLTPFGSFAILLKGVQGPNGIFSDTSF